MLWLVLPLALLVGAVSAGQDQRPMRQLPPPTDIDPQLTEQARELEQQLSDAILRKDAEALDRLVAPEFTLRVADVPQSSLPRTIWMESLKRLKPEPREQRHHAARKLADDRQLGLFALAAEAPGTGGSSVLSDILRRLRETDVDDTSPRQALVLVAELKKLAEDA